MSKSKKMKVLVLSHISELLGGAERSMLDVFDYWADHYQVEPVFIMREPIKSLAQAITERGWQYQALDYTFWSDGNPPKNDTDIMHNLKRNKRSISAIEKLIDELKPDVVMTNSVVCPWAALAAYNRGVPHVWFVREYGDLDHGRTYEIGRQKTYEDVDSLSSLVVANSQTLAAHLQKYIAPEKVTTLYNPFDISAIESLAHRSIQSPFKYKKSCKFVITGNLAPSKGQHEAIAAIAELHKAAQDIELCVIGKSGDPQYQKELDDIVRANNLTSRVHFVGYQQNPLAYVALADVCIMSSRREAFGRVTFEYLAASKPIVGANSGATPEMVQEGNNGYLYESGDIKSLTKALAHYTDNPSLVKLHGEKSHALAQHMMQGDKNIDTLYARVCQAVSSFRPQQKTINFMEYRDELEKNLEKKLRHNKPALHVRTKRVARRYAKAVYVRARSYKTKVTGK